MGGTGVAGIGDRPTGDTVAIVLIESVDMKLDMLFGLANSRPPGVRGELLARALRSKKLVADAGVGARWLKRSGEFEVVSTLTSRGESAGVDFFDLKPRAPIKLFFLLELSSFCCPAEAGDFAPILVCALEIGVRVA